MVNEVIEVKKKKKIVLVLDKHPVHTSKKNLEWSNYDTRGIQKSFLNYMLDSILILPKPHIYPKMTCF